MSVSKIVWRLSTVLLLLMFFFNLSLAQENRNNNVEVDTSDYISGALNFNLMIAVLNGMYSEIDRLMRIGADVFVASAWKRACGMSL